MCNASSVCKSDRETIFRTPGPNASMVIENLILVNRNLLVP